MPARRAAMMVERRWWLVFAWAAVILVITSVPGSALPSPSGVPGLDKLVHLTIYGVLGALVAWALPDASARQWLVAWAAMAAFALLDEWHQRFVPGRGADVMDWVADVAGVMLGAGLTRAALARREIRT